MPPLAKEVRGAASRADREALCAARHGDPFAVLGPHVDGGVWIRALLPGALTVTAIDRDGHELLVLGERSERSPGFFEGHLPRRRKPFAYRLRVQWPGGQQVIDDPYRFPPLLGEADLWLLAEGTHQRPFEALGAHPVELDGVAGTRFAVWAPGAARVSVVGDFNTWDGRRHPMRRRDGGIWEIFLPAVGEGAFYKYEILAGDGRLLPLKADPYGFAAELRPSTASRVHTLPPPLPRPPARRAGEQLGEPLSIYEVHLPSWRRGEGGGFPDWRRLADTLLPYVAELGFTHLELLPISEHPFDGSWGYQPLGLYAPSARFGEAAGLRDFVRRAHEIGLKVIADWVPAHFPDDAHGLGEFDGAPLYEHADPREGRHRDWGTLIYNFGRPQVANYLLGNALYWIERYGLDGLRVDAVASMLYRDYSRPANEWVPNIHGGREHLEAIVFLRRLNALLGAQVPDAATYAEESTAWPLVTRPPEIGGLGFHYKWNLGWMHDVLSYFALDPIHRKYHHHKLSFGLMYAFSENFVLPLSHDEVVHGKGSLLGKMAGDRWQKFANLRALYGFMWTHPGKKLLFMGGEIAQWREWNHDGELDWWLLDDPAHAGVMRLVGDLNRLYRECPALHELDVSPEGFEWLLVDDADASVIAFLRRGRDRRRQFMVICNLTPVLRPDFRIGVPAAGEWRERLNTDSQHYGGGNSGNRFGAISPEPIPARGRAWSVAALLPPLSTVIYEWNSPTD